MKVGIVSSSELGDNWTAGHHLHTHHWIPKREGHLGGEPTYVHTCACGATYRNGEIRPATK